MQYYKTYLNRNCLASWFLFRKLSNCFGAIVFIHKSKYINLTNEHCCIRTRTWLNAQDFGISKFPVVNYANKHMHHRQRELAQSEKGPQNHCEKNAFQSAYFKVSNNCIDGLMVEN
ncbi:hypothetical protein T01_11168 [Trichinella spiralis]|uniref:Uncharacterized protein n=1 Tax=Trichinella spiralis TaxID=6334 RepID=A0A0V1BYW6_TRISP|nr:hypothetical protein T01_11168 [Trichinella spiralis]